MQFCSIVIYALIIILSPVFSNDPKIYIPKHLCVRLTTNTTAIVQWYEPPSFRDEIMGYTVYYTRDPELSLDNWNFTLIGNYPLVTVRDIEEGELYTFRIRLNALNVEGLGPISEDYTLKLVNKTRSCYDQPKIRSLSFLRAAATSYTTIEVWWSIPYDPHFHSGYCVTYGINDSHHWQNVTVGFVQNVQLANLQQSAVYSISLSIISRSGIDHFVQDITVKVQPEEVPLNVVVYDVNANSLNIKWSPPTRFYPVQYKISYDAYKEYEDSTGIKQRFQFLKTEHVVNGHTTRYFINNLSPNTNYNINVSAIPVDHSYRPPSKCNALTKKSAPSPLVKPDLCETAKNKNIQVLLPKASEDNGPIGHYYIVVVLQTQTEDAPSGSFSLDELTENSSTAINSAYITAKFDKKIPYGLILGNGENYGGYTNHKLKSAQKYRLFVRAVVDEPFEELFTDSPYSDIFYLDMPDLKCKYQNGSIK